jgi:hypothetical protein
VTDLQCPATAVLLDGAAAPPAWLTRLRIAGRFDAADRDIVTVVDATADLYRGETFVVAAAAHDIEGALISRGLPPGVPAVIEVDSMGWRRTPLPGA